MKKIFVTGGAGFIGSAFIRLVVEKWPSTAITNFDALTYAGNLDNLEDIDSRHYRFVHGDICDRDAVLSGIFQLVAVEIVNPRQNRLITRDFCEEEITYPNLHLSINENSAWFECAMYQVDLMNICKCPK